MNSHSLAVKKSRLKHPRTLAEQRKRDYIRRAERQRLGRSFWAHLRWRHVRDRADRKGVPFNLTEQDLLDAIPADGNCPVLGIPLVFQGPRGCKNLATIDKTVPLKGYIRGNIAIISWEANSIKSGCTDPDVFRRVADYVERLMGCR